MVDRYHDYLSGRVLDTAELLNVFLLDVLLDDEERESERVLEMKGDEDTSFSVKGTSIRLTPRVVISERSSNEYKLDFSARLRLGALSGRLGVFADSYDKVHDTLEGVFSDRYRRTLEEERSEGATAGLSLLLAERMKSRYSLSGDLRLRPEPTPRLRFKALYRKSFDAWSVEFVQSVFWDMRDGFGEKSEIQFDRPVGEMHHFRTTSTAVWSEISQGVDWGQHSSYYVTFSPRRRLGVTGALRGFTHPSIVVDQYLLRVPYRQRVHRDWLFVGVEPGLDFFREDGYDMCPLVNLKIEVVIGTVAPL